MDKEYILQKAIEYKSAGLEVVPDHPQYKYPFQINHWETREFTEDDLRTYILDKGYGVGVRNIEGIDIDNVGSPDAHTIYIELKSIIDATCPGLFDRILIEKTPRGGYHLVWKCEFVGETQKLAHRPPTDEELKLNKNAPAMCLIETRGIGGQFMIAPSPGYEVVQGDWRNLQVITPDEREVLLSSARSLDRVPRRFVGANNKGEISTGDQPGDIYNRTDGRVETIPLLVSHGWKVLYQKGDVTYLQRPDKNGVGASATYNFIAPGIFYCFTTNGSPFEDRQAYSPWAVLTFLEYGGDFSKSARALAERYKLDKTVGIEGKPTAADQLTEMVLNEGLVIYKDTKTGEKYASVPEEPLAAYPLASSKVYEWIVTLSTKKRGKGFSRNTFEVIVSTLAGQIALSDSTDTVWLRVGKKDDAYYYDLGDGVRAVEITKNGWNITTNVPVKFARYQPQLPQVDPEPGSLSELLSFVNLKNESDKLLLLAHLVTSLNPDIPRAMLMVHGDPGSAKSTLLRLIRSLIDPCSAGKHQAFDGYLLAPPDNPEQLAINSIRHYCTFYDNMSYLSKKMSDALCRAVTGDGFTKRKLYYDTDEINIDVFALIGISGVNSVAEAPDLMSRLLILELEKIPREQRKTEKSFWTEFYAQKPRILGGLFTAFSEALANKDKITLPNPPRMADYCEFAMGTVYQFNSTPKEYLKAFDVNIQRQNELSIEMSPVAQTIIKFTKVFPAWDGKSSDLYKQLREIAEKSSIQVGGKGGFPSDVRYLWRRIKEVRSNLEDMNILIQRQEKNDGTRVSILLKGGIHDNHAESGNNGGNSGNNDFLLPPNEGLRDNESGNMATVATKKEAFILTHQEIENILNDDKGGD